MFTRVVEITTKNGKELCSTIAEKVLPMLRKHAGFVDQTVLLSNTEPKTVLSLTFWKTREDAERYHREDYPKIIESLRHLFEGTPRVRTFDVETSTTHKISRAA